MPELCGEEPMFVMIAHGLGFFRVYPLGLVSSGLVSELLRDTTFGFLKMSAKKSRL